MLALEVGQGQKDGRKHRFLRKRLWEGSAHLEGDLCIAHPLLLALVMLYDHCAVSLLQLPKKMSSHTLVHSVDFYSPLVPSLEFTPSSLTRREGTTLWFALGSKMSCASPEEYLMALGSSWHAGDLSF